MRPRATWGFSGLIAGFLLPLVMFLGHHQSAALHTTSQQSRTTPVTHVQTAALTVPGTYVVRSGDTLSQLAKRFYGSASRWPALWFTNRHKIANPDSIAVGQVLTLTRWHPDDPALLSKALRHVPRAAPVIHTTSSAGASVPAPVAPAGTVSTAGMGAFQQCVIHAESGGNPAAYNPSSGAGGLYQFLLSTWDALGFGAQYPDGAQTAPVSVQNAAFAKEYAESGTSAWAAYDGC